MPTVFEQFAELGRAISNTEFEALPLSGQRNDYLAKGEDGSPVFLLEEVQATRYHPSLSLRYVSAEFQLTCRIHSQGRQVNGIFALIRCISDEADLHELFVRSFDAAREQLSQRAGTEEIKGVVQKLVSLFRAFTRPSQRSISGLWAELFVIERSGNPLQAMRAWRSNPLERFDFSAPQLLLEVKATLGERRVHEFAAEQLVVPPHAGGFVASILLQVMNGGVGVVDLALDIEEELAQEPVLREKLWSNIVGDLGSDFSAALDRRFDITYGERNLTIFATRDIPTLPLITDDRISSVRYTADLSTVTSSLGIAGLPALRRMFGVH